MTVQLPDTTWWMSSSDPLNIAAKEHYPFVPTEGLQGTACDLFRYVGIQNNQHTVSNTCFVDRASLIGLSRVVDGGIASISDLAAAENCLQSILWHDSCSILTPAVGLNIINANADIPIQTYHRLAIVDSLGCEVSHTIDGSISRIFSQLVATDYLVSAEMVTVQDGRICTSTNPSSNFVGSEYPASGWNRAAGPEHWIAAAQLPVGLATPSYISDPRMFANVEAGGFIHRFYEAVGVPWALSISQQPTVSATIEVPWLLSIVLNRADSRDKIPETILMLREEIAPVRQELREFNARLISSTSKNEVEAFCREIEAVFSSTLASALWTNVERRKQRILSIYEIFSGAVDLAHEVAPGSISPLAVALNKLFKVPFRSDNARKIVDRTVTTATFSKLLRDLESLHSLLEHFLTQQELFHLRIDAVSKRAGS